MLNVSDKNIEFNDGYLAYLHPHATTSAEASVAFGPASTLSFLIAEKHQLCQGLDAVCSRLHKPTELLSIKLKLAFLCPHPHRFHLPVIAERVKNLPHVVVTRFRLLTEEDLIHEHFHS